MKLLVMGIKEVDVSKFDEVKNGRIKPKGGLWAAEHTPDEEYDSPWIKWCDREGMDSWISSDGVVLNLKDSAKVFTINSFDDLEELMNEHGNGFKIDFESAAKEYDAIELTENGICETGHLEALYGWDLASVFIMNIDAVDEWEYIKLDIS